MPPSLAKSSMSSLSYCRSLQLPSSRLRKFHTSAILLKIGPESPKFIEIPRPPQRQIRPKRDIKGTLPVPRSIFPARSGPDKTSATYLALATREPTAAHQLSPPATPLVAWKRRLAATRRQNLREGLIELHQRKVKSDKTIAIRSQIKRENRDRRFNAPIREDERLTNPTVLSAMRKLGLGGLPDPNRGERLAESAERVKAKEKKRVDQRKEALHTLYMNARSFITTEAQLEEAIENVFVERPWAHVPGRESATNVWEAYGPPPTVQDMLNTVNNTQRSALDHYHENPAVLTGKRMKRIAEELTGGTMD